MRINIYENHMMFDFKCYGMALSRSHKGKQYYFDSTTINKFKNFKVQIHALLLSLFVSTFPLVNQAKVSFMIRHNFIIPGAFSICKIEKSLTAVIS